MTCSHKTTAFALSLTFDLASIRFKVRPFKLLRTPSPHDHLPRLPILRILSEQSRRFLLGAEQHNRAVADIKAWRNQGLQMRCSEQFHWQLKTALWPGEGRPPVSACKPLCAILLRKPSVPAFTRENERGPFVREAEKCDEKRFGTEL